MSESTRKRTASDVVPTLRLARWFRRLALPVVLVAIYVTWLHFGVLTVPVGMDTMPESYPPGTVCVVDRRPVAPIAPGAVVFVDVNEGVVLAEVTAGDLVGVDLAVRNTASRLAPLVHEKRFPHAAVRALVLSQFLPDVAPDSLPMEGAPDGSRRPR